MPSPVQTYRVFAIKYAHHERRASENFLGGDEHNAAMPLDYFVWAIMDESRVFLVDTGFDTPMAQKRGRSITCPVEEGLRRLDVRAESVEDVIITHMHYDHAGNLPLFPKARYHVQDREMAYCTGRCMCHGVLAQGFEPEHVKSLVGAVFERRVQFHDGTCSLTSGLSVHWVGGHTGGLQIVRVHTPRGWLVLASDAAHFYANLQQVRPFPVVYNVGEMLEGFATANRLAASAAHVVPGHDPLVLSRYRAHASDTAGWIVRLDAEPH
jgi:glyoxylase-like metal-dependent hydrolase (beta-lactamase superfamily II)